MKKSRHLLLLLLILGLTIGTALQASAHDWYPFSCCGGNDCHPIACEAITEKGASLFYHGHEFSGNMIKSTQDAQCHVCIMRETSPEAHPMCIFIQPSS